MNRRDRIEQDHGEAPTASDLDGYDRYELRQVRAERAARQHGDPRNRGLTVRQLLGSADERLDADGYQW